MRTTRRLITLSIVLCSAGLTAPAGIGAIADADAAQPGRWVGSLEGSQVRSTRYVSGGSTHTGDFTFRVSRSGSIDGEAVIAYTPQFDTARLDGLLAFARGLAQNALFAVPFFGGYAAAGLNNFIVVRATFDPVVIRRVPITGRLSNGDLSLKTPEVDGIPFRAAILALKKDVPLTGGSLAAAQPFEDKADVTDGYAVSVHKGRGKTAKGATEKTASYWTAHRVGG